MSDRNMVPLRNYSAALDEIYYLRSLLAREARVVEVQLGYKSLPKKVRASLSASRERLRGGARGQQDGHIQGTSAAKHCLRMAEASDTLTRHEWESQRGLLPAASEADR